MQSAATLEFMCTDISHATHHLPSPPFTEVGCKMSLPGPFEATARKAHGRAALACAAGLQAQ